MKKLKKRTLDFPLDCFGEIMEYNDNPSQTLKYLLLSKRVYEYIVYEHPGSQKNVTFEMKGTKIQITTSYVHKVNLYGFDISKIESLETLENLERLYLSDNEIVNLKPLKTLVNLKRLYLSGNQIVNLKPLETLVNLKGLYLSGNQIVNLEELKTLINLKNDLVITF